MRKSNAIVIANKFLYIIELLIGYFMLSMGILGVIVLISEGITSDTLIGILIFLILGIIMTYFGNKRKKLLITFNIYYNILEADASGSIENIASVVGTSQEVVKKNLKKMIKLKYFKHAYVDEQKNCIALNGNQIKNQANLNQEEDKTSIQQTHEYVNVTCNYCGTINKIVKDTVGECEFCRTQIIG
ncbi:hypothetical protein [Anaeromicropila herbilytica]|uniref:Uncharacterized protein n=1 Tax=Anaeromicropila herbilytica TaxID=2785025 RepID=A0A7R7ICC6_9FIRM|nr:hypothetical protein [Anaeromicropila herbilytica]BCN30603.1 hypothetical protein bsdtb5_18980 [Anaeromicropila herbilytica]